MRVYGQPENDKDQLSFQEKIDGSYSLESGWELLSGRLTSSLSALASTSSKEIVTFLAPKPDFLPADFGGTFAAETARIAPDCLPGTGESLGASGVGVILPSLEDVLYFASSKKSDGTSFGWFSTG